MRFGTTIAAWIESFPEAERHQHIHAGHCCWVVEEEARFLTPEVIQAGALVGTRGELIERLSALHAAGLDQVMVMQDLVDRYEVLERIGRDLVGQVA